METLEQLEAAVKAAELALQDAKSNLVAFKERAENNVFETLDLALAYAEDYLQKQAFEDCEGAYNCGAESYTQNFVVKGKRYRATMTFEYNRHDKMYYYIEESELTYKEIE